MNFGVVFDPLFSWAVWWGLAGVAAATLGLAFWRKLAGRWLRFASVAVLLALLAGPSLLREERAALDDIVIALIDESDSQTFSTRAAQRDEALSALRAQVSAQDKAELRVVSVPQSGGDIGTALFAALKGALADVPMSRLAGVVIVSDGLAHDPLPELDIAAPVHHLRTGSVRDWDRRIIVKNAPSFAIIGEPQEIIVRVEEDGDVPDGPRVVQLAVGVSAEAPFYMQVPVGRDVRLPIRLEHGGQNVVQLEIDTADGELTSRNNSYIFNVNGIRDRLRVLLVSGEPHAGGRTWRNLLKSDSSVDLVHFTILRPPDKHDGVPVNELSLIAFPTRELFVDKLQDFDLIIFDRYKRRGILPAVYLDNVRNYVEQGGAVLISAGPDFASAESLFRSPLGRIIPARPTARVIEERFRPALSETGVRHPITFGFRQQGQDATWGHWQRQVELSDVMGDVLMTGFEDNPLLIVKRVNEGRIALLGSDHAWLWARGYDGGGPQLELLRRLAHWMMKEPDLEEEALFAEQTDDGLRIVRRSLAEDAGDVRIRLPDGSERDIILKEIKPGLFEAEIVTDQEGLFRISDSAHEAMAARGAVAPVEFDETIATDERLAPLVEATRGGIFALEDGMPSVRKVREGRNAAGRGWLGLTPRHAYETVALRQFPLMPPWLALLLFAGFALGAWLREGRR